MEDLLETAAAMARDQHAAARKLPRPIDLTLFMRDFEHEVRAPYLPATLVRAVIRPAAWLARRRGLDAHYLRLRHPMRIETVPERRPLASGSASDGRD